MLIQNISQIHDIRRNEKNGRCISQNYMSIDTGTWFYWVGTVEGLFLSEKAESICRKKKLVQLWKKRWRKSRFHIYAKD